MRSARLLAIATIVSLLAAVTVSPARALGCGPEVGIPVDDGCLFTITGSDTEEPADGFAVTNTDGVPLWDFVASRELQGIGYPITQRWVDGPFTLQAFQKVILQWDPDRGRMNYYNTLDALANRFPQITLANVPPHQVLAKEPGADFATVKENHLALLDQNAKIKTRFLAEPDWLNLYGLPIRYEEREVDGNPEGLQLLRTQRTVFEVWNVPAPGTTVGQVQLQNTPDKVKKLDNVLIPNAVKDPLPLFADVSAFARASDVYEDVRVSPRVQRAINELDWIADGVTPLEQQAITRIKVLAASSEELFFHILMNTRLDGVHREPTYGDLKILDIIINISRLPWIQDGLGTNEHDTFEHVYDHSTNIYRRLKSLNWIPNAAPRIQERALESLYSVADISQEFLTYALDNLWIKGIHALPTARDLEVLQTLAKIASLPWIQVGLAIGFTETELEMLTMLIHFANSDPSDSDQELAQPFLQAIIEMPFLQTLEGPELDALESLRFLRGHHFEHFKHIVATYTTQGGLTDRDARVVPLLRPIVRYHPSDFDDFFSGHGYHLEEREVTLPLTGKAYLAIIRIQPGSGHTMNFLESAVRRVERIMALPFPNSYITLFISESVAPFRGQFFGTHITIQPYFEEEERIDRGHLDQVIIREVARYFWNKSPIWLSEGGVGFVELRTGVISPARRRALSSDRCSQTPIRDLTDDDYWCNYILGARMLHDLYSALDEQAFQAGLRRLHQAMQEDLSLDGCDEEETALCYLRYAFTEDTTPESAAAAWHIISHWYYG